MARERDPFGSDAESPNEGEAPRPKEDAPRARSPLSLSEAEVKALATKFADELDWQDSQRTNQVERWSRYLELYRGEPRTPRKDFPWEGASNLVVSIAAMMVDSTAARIMGALFATEPHWVGEQVNAQFASAVKPMERYLDFGRTRVWDQWEVVNPFVLECCKLGTAVLFNGWQDRAFKRFDEATNTTVDAGRVLGPAPRWIPREDFMIPAGFADMQAAPYVASRAWFAKSELERLAHEGFLERVDELADRFDDETDLRRKRREIVAGDNAFDRQPSSDFGLFVLDNVWFREDLDDDGWPEEYVMVLHRATRTVLRIRANPYIHGLRPFVSAPFVKQEGEFDGIGICQMLEHYQEEITTTHNQRRDNAHLRNTAIFGGRRGSGLTEKTRWWPGRIMLMTDPKTDLVSIPVGGQSVETVTEEQISLSLAKERVGLSDINQGNISSPLGRAAATTVLSALQEGATRREFTTTGIRKALSEQGLQIVELYQTHGLPEPGTAGSPEMVFSGDAEAAQSVRALLEIRDDIRGLIGLKINVATAAVNREVEKQSTLQLFGIARQYLQDALGLAPVLANPQVPQPVKDALVRAVTQGLDPMMRRVFQAFSVYDLDTVLIGDVIAGLAAPQAQPALPPGSAGGEAAPPPNGAAGPALPPGGESLLV